jgi:hypothetical protein
MSIPDLDKNGDSLKQLVAVMVKSPCRKTKSRHRAPRWPADRHFTEVFRADEIEAETIRQAW